MTQSMSGVDSIAHSGTPPAGASFGASLRALREARGWSVGDVSARLKFVPRQIEAIEADRWEDLPQGPSLRGLVRNYARLLDQDPEVMMRAIPAHLQHQPQSNPHLRNTVATDISASAPLERWGGTGARRRRAWFAAILWLIVICVVALAVYLVVAWWLPRMGNGGGNGQETLMPFDTPARSSAPAVTGQIVTPPASTAPAPAPVPAPAAPAETAPSAAGAPAVTPAAPGAPATVPSGAPEGSIAGPNGAAVAEVQAQQAQAQSAAATPGDAPAPATTKPNQVAFSVTTASWVEVRDANGTIVLSSTLQPGAQTSVEAAPPARVVIGNATGVQLQWQGAAVDLAPFRRGNVARLTLE